MVPVDISAEFNPLRIASDRRLNRIAGPSGLVIFGVTGDLSRKKLMPAVYDLANRGLLPPGFALIGFARRDCLQCPFTLAFPRLLCPLTLALRLLRAGTAARSRCDRIATQPLATMRTPNAPRPAAPSRGSPRGRRRGIYAGLSTLIDDTRPTHARYTKYGSVRCT